MKRLNVLVASVLAGASMLLVPSIAGAADGGYGNPSSGGPTPGPGAGNVTFPTFSVTTGTSVASSSTTQIKLGSLFVAVPKGTLNGSQQVVIGNPSKVAVAPTGDALLTSFSVGVVNAAGKNVTTTKRELTIVMKSSLVKPGDQILIFKNGTWVATTNYTVSNGKIILHVKGSATFEVVHPVGA